MLKSIYPPKIVDGYAELFGDSGYQLLVDEHNVSAARYEKYKHNVALQNMWDKCLSQQQNSHSESEVKESGLKSAKKYISRFYKQCFEDAQFLFISQRYSCIRYHQWYAVTKAYLLKLFERRQVLLPESFAEFQDMVVDDLKTHFSKGRRFEIAFNRYVKFVNFINKNYLLKPFHYALPQINKPSRKNPLSIADSWVSENKYIHEMIQLVIDYWGEKKLNSEEEIIASLIFSGIVYGGINNKDWLLPWLTRCLNHQLQPFVDYTLQTTIRYGSAKYGNERIDYESKSLRDQKLNSELFNSHQIIIDSISQCWLVRYYQLHTTKLNNLISLKDIERLLKEFLKIILEPLSIPVPTLSQLLKSASYHWEVLPGVKLNQALVGVLQGSIRTVGLLENSFNNFMSAEYSYCINPYSIHSRSHSLQVKYSKTHLSPSKVDYRKSDIVSFLQEQLDENLSKKYRYPTFNKSNATFKRLPMLIDEPIILTNWFSYGIKKEISAQLITNRELYEQVLVHWVIELLKESEKRKLDTISEYLGKVGNEWCYFMSLIKEDLTDWDEEDFIEFYEGLLEFKSVVQNNKAINQPAMLLQRIHNVGVKFYGFPVVRIEQAKMQVKVRAEWLSVQGYHGILKQIHYSAEPIERDMLMLLIILPYRCGFRKKELLGIQIRDIEGLQLNEPSIIVRPNSYRGLKNQSSKRRVPVYALLTPRELALFNRYVQSKIGQGAGAYLFSTMAETHPIDSDAPLKLLRTMMNYIGESREITFHGLRHTAINNLAILTSANSRVVTALTGYSDKDIKRALTGLNGVHHDGSDKWKALARVVGHLSPSRSFESYCHCAALIATYELANADIKISKKAFINMTGIKSRTLKNNKIISDDKGYISIKSAIPWLFRQVTKPTKEYRKPVDHNVMLSTFDEQTELEIFGASVSDTLLMRYGIHQVLTLLTSIEAYFISAVKTEDAKPQAIAYGAKEAAITPKDANKLYERAKVISAIRTTVKQKESYRFVAEESQLKPMRIYEYIEHELMAFMYKGLFELRETHWEDYEWYLSTVALRITSTHANISFPSKEFDELKRFINITVKLLPNKHLLITANKVLLSKLSGWEGMQGVTTVRDNTVSTYLVGVGISNSVKNAVKKWKYSSVLRFTVHMFLIMDEAISLEY